MATHSGILAWRIPWREEAGGLQFMELQRDGHDWLLVSGKCCLIKQVVFSFLSFYSIGILDSVQFSSVAQSCPTLCDPMNCSTPGLPVQHHLHTVEVRNRFKGLDLIDRVPDELWTEVRDIVQETGMKIR